LSNSAVNVCNAMKEAIRKTLYQVYRRLPKHNHAVIWGWPPGEDSSRALVDSLQHTSVSRIVLLAPKGAGANAAFREPGNKTRIVLKDGWRCWLWFLTARYVFFTHRCLMRKFPANVVSVNVWHGMPFKKIGALLASDDVIRSRYVLATSEFWAPIMERTMRPGGKVLTTGLPRNDRLFSDRATVRRKLGLQERQDVRRIVAWLPTYRKSVRGEIREDGLESGSVFGLADADPRTINEFCRAHDTLLWVKPHPMSQFDQTEEHSHLLIVDPAWLLQRNLSLYELLGASDALVTDISSVAIDYLLLDRPIIHSFPDLDAYRDTRGFTVEPIEDYMAGPITATWAELEKELATLAAGDDPMREHRRKLRNLFHKDKDGHSTQRLLAAIGLQ
jgi:CDP-glycerol glycerophosphotransferase